jgi:nucleoside-diphosphate-sugar epimerase
MTMKRPDDIERHPRIRTILVVGANGNVGRALIPRLLRLGYRVRALQYRSEVPARKGQEVAQGHTLDAESMKRAVEGVDAVCHLIRATGPGSSRCEKWLNCCVVGATNLLEAAKDAPLVRYVAGSADNVFGHVTTPHPGPINENHPKRFADNYYGLFKILPPQANLWVPSA